MPFAKASFPVRKYSLRCRWRNKARFSSRQITGVPDFEHEHQEILSREHLSRKTLQSTWFGRIWKNGTLSRKIKFHRPNVSTIPSSASIKGDRIAATGGPFMCILISCYFSCRGVNRRQVVNRHHHDLKLPCYTLPTTQHHSFFRNLPPLFNQNWIRLRS